MAVTWPARRTPTTRRHGPLRIRVGRWTLTANPTALWISQHPSAHCPACSGSGMDGGEPCACTDGLYLRRVPLRRTPTEPPF